MWVPNILLMIILFFDPIRGAELEAEGWQLWNCIGTCEVPHP